MTPLDLSQDTKKRTAPHIILSLIPIFWITLSCGKESPSPKAPRQTADQSKESPPKQGVPDSLGQDSQPTSNVPGKSDSASPNAPRSSDASSEETALPETSKDPKEKDNAPKPPETTPQEPPLGPTKTGWDGATSQIQPEYMILPLQ